MIESRRKAILYDLAKFGDRHIDPANLLLALTGTEYPWAHPRLGDEVRHPLQESLLYALVLLELADRSRQGLAEQIIGRVLVLQQTQDPAAADFGCWPRCVEDLDTLPPARGGNGIADTGLALAIIWQRHHRRLPRGIGARLSSALAHAASSLEKRGDHEASLAAIFVLLQAAGPELLQHDQKIFARCVEFAGIKAASQKPVSWSGFIDELLALAAIRGLPGLRGFDPLLESIMSRLENVGATLAETAGKLPDDSLPGARSLLGLMLERSGQDIQSGPSHPCLDFRACLACVLKAWVPASAVPRVVAVA